MAFCVWLLSLSIVFQVHPHCSMNLYFIPFYGWIIFHYMAIPHCVYPSSIMDIWFVSTFWLLWIMLLWTFTYKLLCGHMFLIFLGPYLGMELLDHMVTVFSILRNCQTFSKWLYHFTFPPVLYEGSCSSSGCLFHSRTRCGHISHAYCYILFFFFVNLFLFLFIFGCVGSLLLTAGLL